MDDKKNLNKENKKALVYKKYLHVANEVIKIHNEFKKQKIKAKPIEKI